jgi:hypothetical protein
MQSQLFEDILKISDSDSLDVIPNVLIDKLKQQKVSPDFEKQGIAFAGKDKTLFEFLNNWKKWGGATYLLYKNDDVIGMISFDFADINLDNLTSDVSYVLDENAPEILDKLNSLYGKEFKAITEIYLVAFKRNTITLIKDVFALLKRMLSEVDAIIWSVKVSNPIKRAYDKKVDGWNGDSFDFNAGGENFTMYVLTSGLKDLIH